MWPFKKKTVKALNLPPLPPLEREPEEITLLPEEGQIPEELPALELPGMKSEPSEIVTEEPIVTAQMPKLAKRLVEQPEDKFIKIEEFKTLLQKINEITMDFDDIDDGIEKVIELKDERGNRIDNIQDTLEEIGKKLIFIEDTVFGG